MKKSLLFVSILTAGLFAGANVFAQGQSTVQSGKKVTSKELNNFFQEASKAAKTTPNLSREVERTQQQQGVWMWKCDSWPAMWNLFGNYIYWIGPDVYYARYRAVSACSYINGFECLYRCYQVQI